MSRFSGDYKDQIQAIFDEMCIDRYDKNYWELPDDVQYKLYMEAQSEYVDRMAGFADYHRKAEREKA